MKKILCHGSSFAYWLYREGDLSKPEKVRSDGNGHIRTVGDDGRLIDQKDISKNYIEYSPKHILKARGSNGEVQDEYKNFHGSLSIFVNPEAFTKTGELL